MGYIRVILERSVLDIRRFWKRFVCSVLLASTLGFKPYYRLYSFVLESERFVCTHPAAIQIRYVTTLE